MVLRTQAVPQVISIQPVFTDLAIADSVETSTAGLLIRDWSLLPRCFVQPPAFTEKTSL